MWTDGEILVVVVIFAALALLWSYWPTIKDWWKGL